MTHMPGYRRLFGTPRVADHLRYETCVRMMTENPRQFYETFRMHGPGDLL